MKNSLLYYNIGPLLYCPANNETFVSSLQQEKFGRHFSLALCLEDTIDDNWVEDAENKLLHSLQTLYQTLQNTSFFLPNIFIRVRNIAQISSLLERLGTARELVKGFIIPKFSLENADSYIHAIILANKQYPQNFYIMPILESPTMISLCDRASILYSLKEKLDSISDLVLNIRVGGNDLCHIFGFRRHSNESIHSIRPIDHIFSDIITVFGIDYIVSGPVWEYYNGDGWETGLQKELQEDFLCGFIGKTVIHPKQIPVVNQFYQVPQKDFEDAKAILNWNAKEGSFVSGNITKERMNERKTHSNWALRILFLAQAYGVKNT